MQDMTFCDDPTKYDETEKYGIPDPIVHEDTIAIFADLIRKSPDTNRYVRDITFPATGITCQGDDESPLDFFVPVGECYKNVHPELFQFFFTPWTRGNFAQEGGGKQRFKLDFVVCQGIKSNKSRSSG